MGKKLKRDGENAEERETETERETGRKGETVRERKTKRERVYGFLRSLSLSCLCAPHWRIIEPIYR
jgi:hypothetical protein